MNVLNRNPAVNIFQTIAIPANVTAMPMKGMAPKNLCMTFFCCGYGSKTAKVWLKTVAPRSLGMLLSLFTLNLKRVDRHSATPAMASIVRDE